MKTNVKNRLNKKNIPKGDSNAPLSASAIPTGKGKKVQLSLDYRNHIINDAALELPLVEITEPAD